VRPQLNEKLINVEFFETEGGEQKLSFKLFVFSVYDYISKRQNGDAPGTD
jgi:hypothetical protein